LKNLTYALLALLLTVCAASAQQRYNHGVFWFRVAVSDSITSRLKWEAQWQRRTQNNGPGDANIFHSPQVIAYWAWLNYTLNPHVKVSLSPFCYFETRVMNTSPDDTKLPAVKEFRWCGRLEHETKGKLFNFINRYTLEYRYRDLKNNGDYQPNWRVRYQVRLEKPVSGILSPTKPVVFTLSDEVAVQFGKAVRNNPNVFDQNRLYAGAAYEVFTNVKLSVGYLYWFQERSSGEVFDNINTLWTVLTFDNVFSQLKEKK